jgi:peptide deformylase
VRLDIVHWPDPVLSRGTKPIERVDDELRETAKEMARVMVELRGVGLAAPQVGIARRMMLVCPSGDPGDETVVLNPEIVSKSGSDEMEEGCLSFPGLYGKIERAEKVHVRYRDLDWVERDLEVEGFFARIFQHEFDHLNGVVFIDRMTPADRLRLKPQLEDLKKAREARVAATAPRPAPRSAPKKA